MAARKSRKSPEKQRPVAGQADGSSESGETLSPDELARVLRAVAAELERDPALARRVAGALRVPASAPGATAGVPAPPDEMGEAETTARQTRQSGKGFTPRLVTGTAAALGPGVPDPFALREQLGEDGLRATLDNLRLGTLRAVVREHQLDPKGQLTGQNDDAKFRALILRATKSRKR